MFHENLFKDLIWKVKTIIILCRKQDLRVCFNASSKHLYDLNNPIYANSVIPYKK